MVEPVDPLQRRVLEVVEPALRTLPFHPWDGKMSRGPLVLVMEAAQDGSALHSAKSRPPLR